jgi:hypothetical protein
MSDYFRQHYITSSYTKDSWVVRDAVAQRIKQKVEAVGVPLKNWDVQINYGIKTGYNEAFIIPKEKRDEIIGKCPEADGIIRPILRGRDIQKYYADWQEKYLIVSHTGYKDVNGHIIEPVNIDYYPLNQQIVRVIGVKSGNTFLGPRSIKHNG